MTLQSFVIFNLFVGICVKEEELLKKASYDHYFYWRIQSSWTIWELRLPKIILHFSTNLCTLQTWKYQLWMDFSTIRGSDGYFCSVSTGKALHQYTFKIQVLQNQPGIKTTTNNKFLKIFLFLKFWFWPTYLLLFSDKRLLLGTTDPCSHCKRTGIRIVL